MTDIGRIEGSISYLTFEEAFELVKEEVNRALSASPHVVRTYTQHLTGAQGKFIRAASLLTCAMNKDELVHSNAVKLASSIEILHLATLVHDDVIDEADIRRGIPTLQKKYGRRTAVICGDYLLCKALQLASSVPNKQDYLELNMPDYMTRVCTGELYQHINNANFGLTVYQYLKIISGKTAALFEASFFAGAFLSGCDPKDIKQYKKMGRCLGMIFQLIDDCMDFEATESVAQKPVQSDFEKSVITLPIIHAFRKITGLREKAQASQVSQEELNTAVCRCEGIDFTRTIARKYYNKYVAILDKLELSPEKKDRLRAILDKAFRVF